MFYHKKKSDNVKIKKQSYKFGEIRESKTNKKFIESKSKAQKISFYLTDPCVQLLCTLGFLRNKLKVCQRL